MAVGELKRNLGILYRIALWVVAVSWPILMFLNKWAAVDSGNAASIDKWHFDNRLFLLPLAFFAAPSLALIFRSSTNARIVLGIRSALVIAMIGVVIGMERD